MGRGFFRGGGGVVDGGEVARGWRFNGATLLQAWRGQGSVASPGPSGVLQWGHASSSVESSASVATSTCASTLQWGHASSSVESASSGDGSLGLASASMGPRFFKRVELHYRPKTLPVN